MKTKLLEVERNLWGLTMKERELHGNGADRCLFLDRCDMEDLRDSIDARLRSEEPTLLLLPKIETKGFWGRLGAVLADALDVLIPGGKRNVLKELGEER